MNIIEIRELTTIIGVSVGVITCVKAILEYSNQGAQKRAEHFFNLRRKLKENEIYIHICDLLEHDHDDLKTLAFGTKRDFTGIFEEVAIMLNSGQIRERVALHMFGYYAIDCWESDKFWQGMDRESPYLVVFKDFAHRMKKISKDQSFKRSNYRI